MNSPKNTLYLDCEADHIAQALISIITEKAPHFTVTNKDSAYFRLSLREQSITLTQSDHNKKIVISSPVKITFILDQIEKIYSASQSTYIGPYLFDYAGRTLREGDVILHLTEKETEVLAYLNQNRGKSITRDDLLKDVWGYADGIDTHTIETHIYRLRQKIEKNPVEAAILLTYEDGYQLAENI